MPLPQLFYRAHDGQWPPIPVWAEFLLGLGAAAASAQTTGHLVCVVTLPTRSYAALLAAAGAVSAPPASQPAARSSDATAHFEVLAAMKPGATVTITTKSGEAPGELVGTVERGGERFVVVRQKDKTKSIVERSFPERSSEAVQPRGINLTCLIAAQIDTLGEELTEGALCTANDKPLQDIVKIKRFAAGRADYLSEVISPRAKLPAQLKDARPSVVVYDGADAFMRWKDVWSSATSLVLLDRTSRRFGDAVDFINQQYVRRLSEEPPFAVSDVPAGLEVLAYITR